MRLTPTTDPRCIGITTQHYELMPELSADCLNAWVTYGHTPYCTTYYVSTAVILRPQLESRLATLDSSHEALLQVMLVNEINTVKPAQ